MTKEKIRLNIPKELEDINISHAETMERLERERDEASQIADKLKEISDTLKDIMNFSRGLSNTFRPIKEMALKGISEKAKERVEQKIKDIIICTADEELKKKMTDIIDKNFNKKNNITDFNFYMLMISLFNLFGFLFVIIIFNLEAFHLKGIWVIFGIFGGIWVILFGIGIYLKIKDTL